jgi:acetyltransferase
MFETATATVTATATGRATPPAFEFALGHLVECLQLADGAPLTIRPIRAADIGLETDFVRALSKETRYQRLLSARKLSADDLRRLTDIDYRREMALIATTRVDGRERQIGVARYVVDGSDGSADMAIVVADAWQGRGLGELLLRRLLQAAKAAGVPRLTGITLAVNVRMRSLAAKLGLTLRRDPGDATVTCLEMDLAPQAGERRSFS